MPSHAVPCRAAEDHVWKASCALGPAAKSVIKGAAAQGMTALKSNLEELAQMAANRLKAASFPVTRH
jgi:hypothetical protein